MGDALRPLWDFDDLDATERRFRERLDDPDSSEHAEILTQLARVEGLRGRFDQGERLLEEAARVGDPSARAAIRIELERGRLRRSGGDREAAYVMFEAAYGAAVEAGEQFLAVDAAHMAAVAAPDRRGMQTWTQTGIEIAENSVDPQVSRWLGTLLNNLGWDHFEAGEFEAALEVFGQALTAREQYPEDSAQIEIARYAVGKTLRALGRSAEAAVMLERSVAWTNAVGAPDGWFHEELAEDYAALDRLDEASQQAALAIPLLQAADPGFEADTERAARMRALAGEF